MIIKVIVSVFSVRCAVPSARLLCRALYWRLWCAFLQAVAIIVVYKNTRYNYCDVTMSKLIVHKTDLIGYFVVCKKSTGRIIVVCNVDKLLC